VVPNELLIGLLSLKRLRVKPGLRLAELALGDFRARRASVALTYGGAAPPVGERLLEGDAVAQEDIFLAR
jgi:hypothetical protein